MVLLSGQPVRLQPYFGYRSTGRLVIAARALRSGKPGFERGGRIQAMRTMLAQFASREVPGLDVVLELKSLDGRRSEHRGTTDREGFVRFDIDLELDWPLPADPAWEIVCLHWLNREGPQSVEGHVLVPGADTVLAVISDIDDTIVETGITGGFRQIARNWRRVLAQLPDERIAVPGVDAFYSALGGGAVLAGQGHAGDAVRATHRPFFYVSSSPWNLFSYLVAFLRSRKLPLGPLLLRDWGFDRATLGASGHGEHKRVAIEALLAMYPDIRFALIGDDTQGDLPAYADAVTHNLGRVAAVFIRTAAGAPLSPEELASKATIEAAGVPLWLGESYDTGREFLRVAGLKADRDAARIVETVETAHESA
ncbi:App1 family protein [Pelagerythrobacter sp.]|uniref:App1 family protein n=1 Tax=Pelagerythrobacter sp. TaxID=2800702 RepID=UPI0035B2F98C